MEEEEDEEEDGGGKTLEHSEVSKPSTGQKYCAAVAVL